MKLSINGTRFLQDDELTYTRIVGYPAADERLGGLLQAVDARCCVADSASVAHTLAKAPVWRELGALAFTVALQDDAGKGLFTPGGELQAEALGNLKLLLAKAEELDLLPLVRCFSPAGNRLVREGLLGTALDALVDWLLDAGYDRLIVDLRAGGPDREYWPSLRLDAVGGLIDRVRDAVDLHNMNWRHQRRLYIAASLALPAPCDAPLPDLEPLIQRVDVVWVHLPDVGDEDGHIQRVLDMVGGDRGYPRPVLCQGRAGPATLEQCLARRVSWVAAEAEGEWIAALAKRVGRPLDPRSVTLLQHHIKSGHQTVVRGRRHPVRY